MAAQPVPDAHGQNLYADDAELQALLPLYLEPDLCAHLQAPLQRLGALAGGVLDTLALTADKHPPSLQHRSQRAQALQRCLHVGAKIRRKV